MGGAKEIMRVYHHDSKERMPGTLYSTHCSIIMHHNTTWVVFLYLFSLSLLHILIGTHPSNKLITFSTKIGGDLHLSAALICLFTTKLGHCPISFLPLPCIWKCKKWRRSERQIIITLCFLDFFSFVIATGKGGWMKWCMISGSMVLSIHHRTDNDEMSRK